MPYSEIRSIKDVSNTSRQIQDIKAREWMDAIYAGCAEIGYDTTISPFFSDTYDMSSQHYYTPVYSNSGPLSGPMHYAFITCTSENSRVGIGTFNIDTLSDISWFTGTYTDKFIIVPFNGMLLVEYNVSGSGSGSKTPDGSVSVKISAALIGVPK